MLKYIFCEAFKDKMVSFHEGLNIVAGDTNGSNSIGKTSLLLVIDFVFGGETYYNSEDIIKNVGHHSICFLFVFNGREYFFKRSTRNPHSVELCDSAFSKIKEIDIEEYKDFLFTKYNISLPYLSWRELVSLYFRIYNKENCNEIAPLHLLPKESSDVPIPRFLKVFGAFNDLAEQNMVVKEATMVYQTFKKAQQLNLIDQSVTSERRMKKATEDLQRLQSEAKMQSDIIITDSVSLSSEQMTLIYNLRYELSRIQLSRRKIVNRIKELSGNLEQVNANFQIDHDIIDYFPSINIKKIEEVNTFHKALSHILKKEISMQIKDLERRELILKSQEQETLSSIDDVIGANKDAKKMALKNYMAMQHEIEGLVKGIDAFRSSRKYKDDRDNAVRTYNNLFDDVKGSVAVKINKEIESLNDYIYDGTKKSPYLDIISTKKYNFISPDDTGTGSRYRSLIVFDLAVLKLTQLPAMCHDSLLFKNIETSAVAKILEIYNSVNNKQIFIALDEINKLPQKTQDSIIDKIVIRLSPNGSELYGRSWNSK